MLKETHSKFQVWVRKTQIQAQIGLRKLAISAKERIDLDILFGNLAVKLRRISTKLVNIDPTVQGIFDRNQSTLTVRAAEKLKKGDLLESEHIQYRVEAMRPDVIQLPFTLGKKIRNMSCRVAELHSI